MVRLRLLVVIIVFIVSLGARSGGAEILIGVAGPMTGTNAWFGEQMERAAALAVADINAAGGVLGQQVELTTVDDFCDPEQAIAAAKKLVSEGVDLRRRPLLLALLDPGLGDLRGGRSPDGFAGVIQSNVDGSRPCQRFPRHRSRRCDRHRGRQLLGRSLV
jgi:hypothetical protein